MKRTIITLAILTSLSLSVFATADGGKRKKQHCTEKQHRQYCPELGLSDDQKKQMKEICEDFGKKEETVKMSRIAPELQNERIAKLREEKKEAINKILTPEQQKLFAERKNMYCGNGNKDMCKDLNLTDAQKEPMKELRKKQANEQKEMRAKHEGQMSEILTPEQQAKMKERKETMASHHKEMRRGKGEIKKLDAEGEKQFKELKETYVKEKQAIENSRIAPEMQQQKLKVLKEKFESDKKGLFNK